MQQCGIYASDKRKFNQNTHRSPLVRSRSCLRIPQPRHLLVPDTPQTPRHADNTADQSQVVRTRVTISAITADQLAVAAILTVSSMRIRVLVQNAAIHEVEDIA